MKNGILYLHVGEKENWSLMKDYGNGVKAVGLIYDTQDFANGLYHRMRVWFAQDRRLCYLYMR